jgi:hypothetical protein
MESEREGVALTCNAAKGFEEVNLQDSWLALFELRAVRTLNLGGWHLSNIHSIEAAAFFAFVCH